MKAVRYHHPHKFIMFLSLVSETWLMHEYPTCGLSSLSVSEGLISMSFCVWYICAFGLDWIGKVSHNYTWQLLNACFYMLSSFMIRSSCGKVPV